MKGNSIRRMVTVLSLCSVLFVGVTSVQAETRGKVPVTYTREESSQYPLNIEVAGEGEVTTGKNTLRNQKKQYTIPVDESITFHLKADNGGKINKVVLNGMDVLESISENKLVINGAEKEQSLIVEFESKKSGVPQTGDTTGGTNKRFPQTGDLSKDTTRLGLLFVLIAVSLSGITYTANKKKKA